MSGFYARVMGHTRKMRLLIGYNATDFARAAISDLTRAGLPEEAEVLVLTVAEVCGATVEAENADRIVAEGSSLVSSTFPSWSVSTQTAQGVPIREIISAEEIFRPDLVVLGEPSNKSQPRSLTFLGPVSQGVLTGGHAALRITRRNGDIPLDAPNLLVGFDGSEGADKAVNAIASRKWPNGTSVHLLSIDDTGVLGTLRSLSPQMRAAAVGAGFASRWAETLASKALKQLTDAGLDATVEVRSGHPQTALIDAAKEWNADCIFVGPHTAGTSSERFLLGSVSASVAAHANCTVEIVR